MPLLSRVRGAVQRLINQPVQRHESHHPQFPADFLDWAQRPPKLRGRRLDLRLVAGDPTQGGPSVAAVVHVHYPELVPEILSQLAVIPVRFDLLITDSSGSGLDLDFSALPHLQRVWYAQVANHGRDILPLIHLVNDGALDPYSLVVKVHTKKSAWRADHPEFSDNGERWRGGFFDALLASEHNVQRILTEFADDPTLGVLTAPGNIRGPEFWGGDRAIVRDLLLRVQMHVDEDDLRFPSGSMYWIRGFLLQALRSLDLTDADFEPEDGQVDGTTAHGVERAIGFLAHAAGYDVRETDDLRQSGEGWRLWAREKPAEPRARIVPFYLPQYHRIPENDAWWGRGFTEWSNVAAGRPNYPGHVQPLLPGELGFYDLSDAGDTRRRQYQLATDHGIAGFMYYYYWFAGKKLLNGPVEALSASSDDHPFCIMWANENWTRSWDGSNSNVLLSQDYEAVAPEQFIDDVMPLLTDNRYVRVDGRPLIAIYKIAQLPAPRRTMDAWRSAATSAGLPGLHIVSVDVGRDMDGLEGSPEDLGFDAYLEFAPHNFPWDGAAHEAGPLAERFHGNVLSYRELVERAVGRLLPRPDDARYPGVMVNFDNTARRQWRPDLWYGSNPFVFRRWLTAAVDAVADRSPDQRIVFVNAWNEWAESAVLEPSQRFGRGYLHAVRDAVYR